MPVETNIYNLILELESKELLCRYTVDHKQTNYGPFYSAKVVNENDYSTLDIKVNNEYVFKSSHVLKRGDYLIMSYRESDWTPGEHSITCKIRKIKKEHKT